MRLKELREDLDIPQRILADYLNIKQNTYSQYENEARQIPIDLLIKLAKYFNVSTDYILGVTDTKEPLDAQQSIKSLFVPLNIFHTA